MIACTRRSASSASRASACASARTCAASGDGRRCRCGRRRAAFRCRGSAATRPARRRRSHARLRPRLRSAARRLWASVSADLRAAWRLISRSVVAWRSRAASASRWAARQASRAALSAAAAAFSSASAVFQRLALGGGVDAGLLQFVLDIDQARALGETPRGAGRRMRGGDKAVPAPDVAFGRHQPLAGLELRHQFRAALLRHDADLRQAARQLGRRLRHGRRAARRRRAAPDRRRSTPALVQRIGAEGSTGASRSSPSAAPSAFS